VFALKNDCDQFTRARRCKRRLSTTSFDGPYGAVSLGATNDARVRIYMARILANAAIAASSMDNNFICADFVRCFVGATKHAARTHGTILMRSWDAARSDEAA